MKVTLLTDVTGTRDGVDWPPRYSVVDLPENEAKDMIRSGMVREATSEDQERADKLDEVHSDLAKANDEAFEAQQDADLKAWEAQDEADAKAREALAAAETARQAKSGRVETATTRKPSSTKSGLTTKNAPTGGK